jgi:glycosyltransferase involved in cell wall biosynthesis
MGLRVCFIYPWATFGGVERVLLNRLQALRSAGIPLSVDIFFFHDAGGLQALQDHIDRHGLQARVQVQADGGLQGEHDLVFCIDAPQAVGICHQRGIPYVVECHTAYAENRRYLRDLPATCRAVLTPSALFSQRIRGEVPPHLAASVSELRNGVPREAAARDWGAARFPAWGRRPLLYFGRLDHFKNPLALLDAFLLIEAQRPGLCIPVFCGPASAEIDMPAEIRRRGLARCSVVLPAVPFSSAGMLFGMLAGAQGLFVSPSQGESFGLSAAEAISAGVPVVLSDIEAHRFLVQGHEDRFTYLSGQTPDLARQVLAVLDNYGAALHGVTQLCERLSTAGFLQDWQALMHRLDLAAACGTAPAFNRPTVPVTGPDTAPSPAQGMPA